MAERAWEKESLFPQEVTEESLKKELERKREQLKRGGSLITDKKPATGKLSDFLEE